ncbi:hypothetical protein TNCV_1879961 [Trichonephila clavipes]|nr:hypothetical protein TNCV_1879961 [Trichonephila clavipes]
MQCVVQVPDISLWNIIVCLLLLVGQHKVAYFRLWITLSLPSSHVPSCSIGERSGDQPGRGKALRFYIACWVTTEYESTRYPIGKQPLNDVYKGQCNSLYRQTDVYVCSQIHCVTDAENNCNFCTALPSHVKNMAIFYVSGDPCVIESYSFLELPRATSAKTQAEWIPSLSVVRKSSGLKVTVD